MKNYLIGGDFLGIAIFVAKSIQIQEVVFSKLAIRDGRFLFPEGLSHPEIQDISGYS